MNSSNGSIYLAAGINTSGMARDAAAVREMLHGIGDTARDQGEAMDVLALKARNVLGALGVATGLKEFTQQVFSTRAGIESLSISFETLLGSKDKAAAMFEELRQYAVTTPMLLKDLAQGAQTMLSFNIADDEVMTYLKAIGDISMGDAQKFNSLTLAFSQMSAAGKLMGQDLMQMIGQGFNPLSVIAEQTGKKLSEVKAEMEAGRISVQQVQQAFIAATSEGGKFNGMLDKQSKGLAGAYSNLQGAVDDALNSIGEKTQGLMMTTLEAGTAIAKQWEDVAAAMAIVAGGWGVQKMVDMTAIAMADTAAVAAYEAEAAALSALIPAKEGDAAATASQTAARANLTEAQTASLTALRAEATAHVEALQLKAEEAQAAQLAAAAKVTAARQELAAAEELLAAEYAEYEACNLRADAAGMAAAEQNIATATEMRDTAATAANTAATEMQTATENANTASREANTAAARLDTAATAGNTAATNFLTLAKQKCTLACQKLWATMAANPVGLVVAAVAALAYGIYKLVTYQTEAEKSQNALNTAMAQAEAKAAEETAALRSLWSELEKAEKGTKEWKTAKDAVVAQFGKYYAGLDAELEKVNDLAEVYARLTTEIKRSEAAKALKSVSDEYAPDNKDFLADMRKRLTKEVKSEEQVNRMMDEISSYIYSPKEQQAELSKETKNVLLQSGKGLFDPYGNYTRVSMQRDKQRQFQKQLDDSARNFGFKDAADVMGGGRGGSNSAPEERGGKEIDDEIKKKKEELAKEKVGTAEWKKIDAEITALREERKQYGDYDRDHKTKKQTGLTAEQLEAREESAEGKLADVLRKQQTERLRIEQDFEFERWQNRIDLMDEGEQKVLAQQKLNFEKEKVELQRRMESELESELQRQMAVFDARQNVLAAADKKYAKQTFRDSDIDDAPMEAIKARYAELEEDLTKSQQKAEDDRSRAAREAMNAYLKEFGSYQQKRVAITEEYERKIAEAQNPGERRSAIAGRDRALADLDFNQWQEGGGMSQAFGDLSKLSKQAISGLISDMERYRSKIIATFDPDKIKKFEDALSNLRQAEAVDSFFGDNEILDALRERLALQKQVADAQADEVALLNQKKQIEEELNAITALIMAPSIGGVEGPDGEQTQTIDEEAVARAEELRVKLDAVSNALSKSTLNARQLEDRLKSMGKVKFADISKFSKSLLTAGKNAGSLAKIFSDDIGDAITDATEALDGMFDAFTTLSSNIDTLSKAGKEAVDNAAQNAEDIVSGAAAGITTSAAVASQGLSTLEKASAILAIIGAAIQLATIVASLFDSDKKHEENIKNLQKQIDSLQKSYDRLGKAASEAFSTNASALIEQQNRNLMLQKALVRQQMMEEQEKKKSDDEKMQEYQDRLDEIDEAIADNKQSAKEAIIGDDVKSAISDFSSALTQAWAEGRNAAEATKGAMKSLISSALTEDLKKNIQPAATAFYDALAEAMEDGVLTDAELANLDRYKEDMDAAAEARREQYEMIEQRYKDLDELREELTDISFDSVADNFKSLLTDMESTAADFTDNFSEMLRGALVEGLMTSKYDQMLKDWYEGFADAMSDNQLTDDERERLRQEYDAIVQQGLADRAAINEIVGGGAYSQSASTGGWETMGQDQAMELNGRFTALTELSAIGNQYLAEGNAIAARVLATLEAARLGGDRAVEGGDNDTLLSIKDMMFLSTGYLEDIAKYSRHLATIDGGIEELRNLIDKRL